MRQDKPIGKRNGINIYTRLKAKKPLNRESPKHRAIQNEWRKTTEAKSVAQDYLCSWCKLPGIGNFLEGHHTVPRRYNVHTQEVCYPVHPTCHVFITDNNIDVRIYPNRMAWENRISREV